MSCKPCSPSFNIGDEVEFDYKGKTYTCKIIDLRDKAYVDVYGKKKVLVSYKKIHHINSNKDDTVLKCSASCCKRTNRSHPVNFRGLRPGATPLCQGHYIQKNKKGFKEFKPIRASGKSQMKYNTRVKTNDFKCDCGKAFNSLQSLRSHQVYISPKTGKSLCKMSE